LKVLGQKFSPAGWSDLAHQVANAGDKGGQGPVVSDANGNSSSSSTTSTTDNNNDRLISIVGAVGIGSDLARSGWVSLVFFIAIVNLFLGLVNLVPLLPFDGGHIAIAVYEKVRSIMQGGKRYQADVAKLLPLTYGVVMVLAFIGLSTIYLDIVSPVRL
jgi:membrane-associated protease RseP (regulator of RpoE activity)